MIPVVTPQEMRAIDDAAQESVETLIDRAARCVAELACDMLGDINEKHVVVVAGKGNNGNDGRKAAEYLRSIGITVDVVDPSEDELLDNVWPSEELIVADLVIDAAFGTGFRGEYRAPKTNAPVLAVDIPSGVDGATGNAAENAQKADKTVTFGALKPGLLFNPGRSLAGSVEIADIGLDVTNTRTHVVTNSDVVQHIRVRGDDSHKWASAVMVVAGSPGMHGAAQLCARGAQRGGAAMVRVGSPGLNAASLPATEAVGISLDSDDWAEVVLEESKRVKAIVIGPGLGRSDNTVNNVVKLVAQSDKAMLIDADALWALAQEDNLHVVAERNAPTVLTPHDGEFETLTGTKPGDNRIDAARKLASEINATILLKGSTTVVANAPGQALISVAGSGRLATAGTGDVLSGVIGAFLAQGVEPIMAAALGAHVHGEAAKHGRKFGLIASDLPELVADLLSELCDE